MRRAAVGQAIAASATVVASASSLALAAALAPACSSHAAEGADAGGTDASEDGGTFLGPDAPVGDEVVLTHAPTFDAIWGEILQPTCAIVFCHAGAADYLHLWSEPVAYQSLVDAAAEGPMCAPTGLVRVAPFHPETSLLYLKVTSPPCGARMPLLYGYSGTLDPRQVDQIRQWIACGALDGDAGCPADAAAD